MSSHQKAVNPFPPESWDSANNVVSTNYPGYNSLHNCYLVCVCVSLKNKRQISSSSNNTTTCQGYFCRFYSFRPNTRVSLFSLSHTLIHAHIHRMRINLWIIVSGPQALNQNLHKKKKRMQTLSWRKQNKIENRLKFVLNHFFIFSILFSARQFIPTLGK